MIRLARPQEAPRGETLDERIGRTIRRLRRRDRLTLDELGQRSGVSRAMISKIERGESSASLASLEALAAALGVPIVNFFSSTVDQEEISFVPAGEGVAVTRAGATFGHDYRVIGRVGDPDLFFEPYLITIRDRVEGQPLYSDHGIEFIHVTDGAMRYRWAEREFDLRVGDSLTFAAAAPHGPVALLAPSVTFLTIVSRHKARD